MNSLCQRFCSGTTEGTESSGEPSNTISRGKWPSNLCAYMCVSYSDDWVLNHCEICEDVSMCGVQLQKLLFSATLSHDPEKLNQLRLFQPLLFTSGVKRQSDVMSSMPPTQRSRMTSADSSYLSRCSRALLQLLASITLSVTVYCLIQQGVALMGRNTTGPPRAAPCWVSCTTLECCRRRETPAIITSLPPTLCVEDGPVIMEKFTTHQNMIL